MSLEKKDVEKVARLARLKITDEEATRYGTQLSNIINFVEQLKEVDTDNVEPLASVVDIKLRLREDVVTDGGIQADVIANAPESLEGFFVVPKVVE
ncbi:MAG: Asp-tRNA(Asn)/Glu-tRNA(Gln) amidotransferase subunit GatC [Alphaproteobacteria bacterium]|nr:Asp-tRNA(Asn)/Glu-tRNA(Gln) amidotransferase subunit GatC [Alphaproteobacteria bacterium]NCQ87870.1 Asp-tRNA(Asn)/Glu-tRNA(Gln) amidotransferase subunit GatC [Alphaproteobacteria bacterium]NCT05622.1 Asp-tRNA(Asn)/Glu-tRNA(Gln) amidotransferase subunit GatC [Alphaproteobacteria bacterium]